MKERYVREIIAGFPYPIVANFIKLGTDECLDHGPLRLQYILSTAEAISRFLGIVTLCECRELLEDRQAKLPSSLVTDFHKRFGAPSWGSWIHFTREGLKWLMSSEVKLTMPEVTSFYFKKPPAESRAAVALGRLLTIRNELSHQKLSAMHGQEFSILCEETYPLLEEVLESLGFLLDYELAFISQIEVDRKRKRPPTFLHRLSKLIGDSLAFRGDRKALNEYMDSSAILLLNTEDRRYLNLDPLLVREETAGKAPDIFFFNGLKKSDVALYAACNQGGSFLSSDSRRFGEMGRELQNLVDLFSAKCTREREKVNDR
jgi:hypothetical protein